MNNEHQERHAIGFCVLNAIAVASSGLPRVARPGVVTRPPPLKLYSIIGRLTMNPRANRRSAACRSRAAKERRARRTVTWRGETCDLRAVAVRCHPIP